MQITIFTLAVLMLTWSSALGCNQATAGYDWDDDMPAHAIVGMVLGYLVVSILLIYVIVRLFWEERVRAKEHAVRYHDAVEEGRKYGITYENIVAAEKAREKDEKD